jgi:hypothetical protein
VESFDLGRKEWVASADSTESTIADMKLQNIGVLG